MTPPTFRLNRRALSLACQDKHPKHAWGRRTAYKRVCRRCGAVGT